MKLGGYINFDIIFVFFTFMGPFTESLLPLPKSEAYKDNFIYIDKIKVEQS